MGIKDLNKFITEFAPEGIKETHLNEFSGKKVAIDTSIFMYKFLYKNPRFIEGFFQQINRLKRNNITPIYIFDGIPPSDKDKTLAQRKQKKTDYKNKIQEIELKLIEEQNKETKDNELIKQLNIQLSKTKKKFIHVTKEHIEELKHFLDLCDIKYIHPECEADALCSKLCENNIVDLVLSDDMDLLTSGTKILLRNFFITSNKITSYNLEKILEKLDINYDQWVDFCILCGCDYVKRIKGVGPKNAYKLIKQHKSLDNIMENVFKKNTEKYIIPDSYNYVNARELFKHCNEFKEDFKDIELEPNLFDNQKENIIKYLLTRTHLTEKQINNRINNIFSK